MGTIRSAPLAARSNHAPVLYSFPRYVAHCNSVSKGAEVVKQKVLPDSPPVIIISSPGESGTRSPNAGVMLIVRLSNCQSKTNSPAWFSTCRCPSCVHSAYSSFPSPCMSMMAPAPSVRPCMSISHSSAPLSSRRYTTPIWVIRKMSACSSESKSPTEIVDATGPRTGRSQSKDPSARQQNTRPSLEAAAIRVPPSEAANITGADVAHVSDVPPISRSQSKVPSASSAARMPSVVTTATSTPGSPSRSPTDGWEGLPLTLDCQRTFPVAASNAHTVPDSSVWTTS